MAAPESARTSRSDAQRNRRVLLEACADALARDPGASMADIARAANLTRATLYRHFGSRERLIDQMRAQALVSAAEAIAGSGLDRGSALAGLRRVIDAVVSLGARFRPLLLEGADQTPAFLAERSRVFAPVAVAVRRGQRAGEIRDDVPAEWVVTVFMSLLTAGVREAAALSRDGNGAADSAADMIFRTLRDGVGQQN